MVSGRDRQKAQTDTRVCRSIRHREKRLLCVRKATQKVSAVSGRVKKEEEKEEEDDHYDDNDDGQPIGGRENGEERKRRNVRANTAAAVSHRGSK